VVKGGIRDQWLDPYVYRQRSAVHRWCVARLSAGFHQPERVRWRDRYRIPVTAPRGVRFGQGIGALSCDRLPIANRQRENKKGRVTA
jgi:hypothetical protein